jgi:hypothetical protein
VRVTEVEEIRANRPPEVGVARVLLIIAVLLWIPIVGVLYTSSTVGLVGILMFLVVFGSFGAVKGRQAGRVMATVAVALTYLFLLPYAWLGFSDPYLNGPAYAVMDLVAVVLSAVALGFLYAPNSNRYVHMVTAARR